jgi:uncharacterized protein (DUF1697 family)
MARYVAFLRAINVGGRVVKMAVLAAHFSALGATRVRTHIASGNVIFDSASRAPARLAAQLEDGLEPLLGFRSEVFLRRADEVVAIAERGRQWSAEAGPEMQVHIGFLAAPPPPANVAAVQALKSEVDAFRVDGSELLWTIRGGVSDSQLTGAKIERALGGRVTFRKAGMLLGLAEALAKTAD